MKDAIDANNSDAFVLFGVTGDLVHKMIFPALYSLVKRDALKVPVIGIAMPKCIRKDGGVIHEAS